MTNRPRNPGRGSSRAATLIAMPLGLLLLASCAASGPGDSGTVFYPPLPELPRLQFLTTINTEEDIGGSSSEFSSWLLGKQQARKIISKPFDIAHEKGKIYIVDTRFKAVVIIDLAERKFDYIKDTKAGPLRQPMGVFVTDNGYKYVADKQRGQIIVYNERNEFFRAYGTEGQFQPLDVAVDGDRIYVCDVAENEIEVLDRESGEVIDKIGETGPETGQFQWPTRLTLDAEGNLYVTDFLNFRVQKFDREGNFVKQIGELGTFPGAMPRPKGIAVDRDGYLYTVDAAFELVQIFDGETAEVVLGFGKFGPEPGGNWLPAGVHIDYDNLEYFAGKVDRNFRPKYLVYVANQSGERKLNVYAFGDWIGPLPEGAKQPKAAGS